MPPTNNWFSIDATCHTCSATISASGDFHWSQTMLHTFTTEHGVHPEFEFHKKRVERPEEATTA